MGASPVRSRARAIPKPPVAPKPGWAPPRTAWGDPDISGNFTNKYEQGTPMERPAGFEGRGVDDVRGAELKKLLEERQRQSDARQQFLAGDPTGRIAVLPEFGDRGEIVKGNRAWMIIDPADGKMPAMTEEGQRRTPWREPGRTGRAANSFSNVGFDSHLDFSLTDVHHAWVSAQCCPASTATRINRQGPICGIRYEMARDTNYPADSRPHVRRRAP
jgi:hypothetical protein